ncbi:hypothetical protein [Amycolatopsis circi]|uniref:hypothetical protein n=1 Tax=Amycolatopsis circi TaxID=871959 RepID=UPI000E23F47C|nr:hypothetical protein [Amycolatopsis circi]
MSDDSNTGDIVIEPTTVELYDTDGRQYFTAAGSVFAENGLKDGTLTAEPPAQGEEANPSGPEVPPAGDPSKSGKRSRNSGSGDGDNPPA